jgi:hypothetical protein
VCPVLAIQTEKIHPHMSPSDQLYNRSES